MKNEQYEMYLILNTHWDREYRWSFRETQMRLAEAADILVDTMLNDKRFKYFHPDSQASFLDDYLEIRPEKRKSVEKLVREGRILPGPWYTLPAEFLVSGEALVRNLLLGHSISNKLGGVMKCAYNIFSWGQVSQLPQIYRQFGMDTILFYRGIDQSKLDKLEFWWDAPDGSRAMGLTFGSFHRLNFWIYVYNPYIKGGKTCGSTPSGDYNYDLISGNGGKLAKLADNYSTDDMNYHVMKQPMIKNVDAALKGMDTLLDTLKGKTSTNKLLLLQGFDQENPDPCIPDLIEEINKRIGYGKIKIGSLPEYVADVRKEMAENGSDKNIPLFKGEMLSVETSGDAFAPLYNGVFSARMPVKMRNADCQYRLERWAEPAASWRFLTGAEYPGTALSIAWRNILQNQQHDGIGGCHVDRIQLAMEERYRTANDISECVTRDALKALVAEIDFSNIGEKEIAVTVFNSTSFRRCDTVEATVDIPHSWEMRFRKPYKYPLMLEMEDNKGKPVDLQIIGVEDEELYGYLKYGNAITFSATRIKIAFTAEVPQMGYASYKIRPKPVAHRPVETVSPRPNVLENEFLMAEIKNDGSVDLLDKASGKKYCALNAFEDGGECGGPLTHYRPNGNAIYRTIGQPANIALVNSGPITATYRIEREWNLPEGITGDIKIHVPHGAELIELGAMKRSETKKPLKISTEVTLRRGSRMLEFKTTVENNIKDHRLRALFPTGMSAAKFAHADSPFDVVGRKISVPDSTGWYEEAARTFPTSSFVDVSDGKNGLALLHYGLSEYEVTDDSTRTIAVTLLRCFGNAGNPTELYAHQILAQCQGRHVFSYAIMPHSGDWLKGDVLKNSVLFTSPLRAMLCSSGKGSLPRESSFFGIDNENFVITALKKAEDEDALVLRGYNPTEKQIKVDISLPDGITCASQVTLEEKIVKDLKISKGKISLSVGKKEILSIMLRR
jgi:mannosylglycerate hydrolase